MFGSQRQLETRDYTSPSKGGYQQFTIHGLLVNCVLVYWVCLVDLVYLLPEADQPRAEVCLVGLFGLSSSLSLLGRLSLFRLSGLFGLSSLFG